MQERVLAALAVPLYISCLPSLHPFRTVVVQLRQHARLASSFLASAGVCPLLLFSARAVLPLAQVLGRHLNMVIDLWVSIPERCGRDPAGTFVSQSAAQLDRPGILVAPSPGLLGAVGVEDYATGPAV
ncbi:hypothetical protein GOODEAATRI_010762 [Goodea atripinnis]|uniref:Uncharacterized protein n=1 Tax=Goodea atripinnis TaxID=208336 RepID=A0ABV0MU27_9TELE